MIKIVMWLIGVANVVGSAVFLGNYPADIIPIHYNIAGEADNWGSKWWWLIFAAVPLILMTIFELYNHFTKKNESVQKNKKVQNRIIPLITLLFVIINWILLLSAKNGGNSFSQNMYYILLPFGLLFIFIGNFMGKIQLNHYLGIRVKWTLNNETVWRKTHRLAGVLYILTGALTIVWTFICKANSWQIALIIVFLVMILAANAISIVYAYNLSKKQ